MTTKTLDITDLEQPNVRIIDLAANLVDENVLEYGNVPEELFTALEEAHQYTKLRGDEAFVVIRIKPEEV